ncbi:hypothetical protein LD110_22515, partial [Arthrobacter sp. M4]|nr:hypothetical protein [Arthrobacter sp. M4]
TTDPGNLALLCKKHHALKSIGAWSYRHTSPTGHLNWTSPLGRKHTTEPASFRVSADPPTPLQNPWRTASAIKPPQPSPTPPDTRPPDHDPSPELPPPF